MTNGGPASETVASGPGGNNGQVTYTLDNVGNRLQRNSTLPAIPATGLLNYDLNDRVSTDAYDANGNTVQNSGQTNVYDFENRLVQRGGVTMVYDGDGNRVKETVAGVTTSYLCRKRAIRPEPAINSQPLAQALANTFHARRNLWASH